MENDPLKDPQSVKYIVASLSNDHFSRKRGMNWLNSSIAATSGLNLQSSAWNERKGYGRHYLNVGCNIEALCGDGREYNKNDTTVTNFPLSFRYMPLLANGERVDDAPWFNDGVIMPIEERRYLIKKTLQEEVFPLTDSLLDLEWIKSAHLKGWLKTLGLVRTPQLLRELDR